MCVVVIVAHQRSIAAHRVIQLGCRISVVENDEDTGLKSPAQSPHPRLGMQTDFRAVTLGKLQPAQLIPAGTPGRIGSVRKAVVVPAHSDALYSALAHAKPVHGQSIGHLIGQDHARKAFRQLRQPPNAIEAPWSTRLDHFPLTPPQIIADLQDQISAGPLALPVQRLQHLRSHDARTGAHLQNLTMLQLIQDVYDQFNQTPRKQIAQFGRGNEITALSKLSQTGYVVPVAPFVKRQLHEARKSDHPPGAFDLIDDHARQLPTPAFLLGTRCGQRQTGNHGRHTSPRSRAMA